MRERGCRDVSVENVQICGVVIRCREIWSSDCLSVILWRASWEMGHLAKRQSRLAYFEIRGGGCVHV
jgi:hypothetical protein